MGQPAVGNEFEADAREVGDFAKPQGTDPATITTVDSASTQAADTPGNDENKDGLTGGQATADVTGDILGV